MPDIHLVEFVGFDYFVAFPLNGKDAIILCSHLLNYWMDSVRGVSH